MVTSASTFRVKELTAMPSSLSVRNVFAVLMLAVALVAAGCAGKQKGLEGNLAGGAATPGSAQDFQVNVGDRVFFETDSSNLTPQSMATLDRQVQWLNQYPRYSFTIEGHADERGKIGRATCRERVKVWVVVVQMRKNNVQ